MTRITTLLARTVRRSWLIWWVLACVGWYLGAARAVSQYRHVAPVLSGSPRLDAISRIPASNGGLFARVSSSGPGAWQYDITASRRANYVVVSAANGPRRYKITASDGRFLVRTVTTSPAYERFGGIASRGMGAVATAAVRLLARSRDGRSPHLLAGCLLLGMPPSDVLEPGTLHSSIGHRKGVAFIRLSGLATRRGAAMFLRGRGRPPVAIALHLNPKTGRLLGLVATWPARGARPAGRVTEDVTAVNLLPNGPAQSALQWRPPTSATRVAEFHSLP